MKTIILIILISLYAFGGVDFCDCDEIPFIKIIIDIIILNIGKVMFFSGLIIIFINDLNKNKEKLFKIGILTVILGFIIHTLVYIIIFSNYTY